MAICAVCTTAVPQIVARAHQDGLRVSAHVETAVDFRHAMQAGVDEFTHLPGWFAHTPEQADQARLTEDDAQCAAQHGVFVVTTTVASTFMVDTTHHHGHGGGHQQALVPGMPRASGAAVLPVVRETLVHSLHAGH
jgi:hypothetical protein